MANLDIAISYTKRSQLVISTRDLLDMYFYGIDTRSKDGTLIPDHIYRSYILAAQQEVEKYLGIKIIRQVIEEDLHYYGSDWTAWGLIQTAFPVEAAISMKGYYGSIHHINVPEQWLKTRSASDDMYHRAVWLLPNGTGNYQASPLILNGMTPMLQPNKTMSIPDYWKLRYITGFTVPPMDLVNIIGKLASIGIFNVLGDIILGAGIASQSLSIDGLSQSISTTSSAENSGYSARISMYQKEIKEALPKIERHYTGIKFTCV